MSSLRDYTRLLAATAFAGALFAQLIPTGAFAANDAAIKTRTSRLAQTQAVTFPAKKMTATRAQKRAISAAGKSLASGKLLITAPAGTFVTQPAAHILSPESAYCGHAAGAENIYTETSDKCAAAGASARACARRVFESVENEDCQRVWHKER